VRAWSRRRDARLFLLYRYSIALNLILDQSRQRTRGVTRCRVLYFSLFFIYLLLHNAEDSYFFRFFSAPSARLMTLTNTSPLNLPNPQLSLFLFAMASNQFDRGPNPEPLQAHSERTHASKLIASSPRTWRLQLGVDFQPSHSSVICGRGKASYDHPGNRRLRMLASTFVEDYSQAGRELAKSAIVANIVAVIRQGGGRFFKHEKGAWFEVGDYYARVKVSALFRDMLHSRYRSSSKARTAPGRTRAKQNETHTQQYGQQLVNGTGYSDDSSISSYSSRCSTDSLGFDYSLEVDIFDIDVVF
jgi:hypothetical protein